MISKQLGLGFVGMISLGLGCSSEQPRVFSKETHAYQSHSPRIQKKIDQTCKRLGITHFVIKNRRVILKKQTGEAIGLTHYQPVMPDGYYYCRKKSQDTDLE